MQKLEQLSSVRSEERKNDFCLGVVPYLLPPRRWNCSYTSGYPGQLYYDRILVGIWYNLIHALRSGYTDWKSERYHLKSP